MTPYRKNTYEPSPDTKFPETILVRPKWMRQYGKRITLSAAGLIALAASFTFCTPAEQNASSKLVADVAQCIEAKTAASGPGSDPGAVALSCGLEAAPDIIAVIVSVIDAKKNIAASRGECVTVRLVDAGAQPDSGGK